MKILKVIGWMVLGAWIVIAAAAGLAVQLAARHPHVGLKMKYAVFLIAIAALLTACDTQDRIIPYCTPDDQFSPGLNTLVWNSQGRAFVLQTEYGGSRVRYVGRLPAADRKPTP